MKRRAVFPVLIAFAFAAVLVACNGVNVGRMTGLNATGSVGMMMRGKINHVIVIVQENRTFDNIFAGQANGVPSPYPGADASWPPGVAPYMSPAAFADKLGPDNFHNPFQCLANANWTLDAWIAQSNANCKTGFFDPVFLFLDTTRRNVYWEIAQRYILGDSFFAVTSTGSFPAHQFIVAQQSADTYGAIVADQPSPSAGPASCFASPDVVVQVPELQPNGMETSVTRGYGGLCYPWQTYGDTFPVEAPAFWKHYTTQSIGSPGVFDGFINMLNWFNQTLMFAKEPDDLYADIQRNGLPKFAWVKPPCIDASDHPGTGNGGPSWVGSVINKIGSSPAWPTTVIFVIWDDWGGFYDHRTPPPQRPDRIGPGLRIPFLMISPYGIAKSTVVHTVADYGSIMKFVDDLYGLRPLNSIDANATDLVGFFNTSTSATPAPFQTIVSAPTFDPSVCNASTTLSVD
jgi:phospholipase C